MMHLMLTVRIASIFAVFWVEYQYNSL